MDDLNDDLMAGVLYDRTRELPQETNPQTRAERLNHPHDRPMHYGTGLRATICEVYYAFKQTTDKTKVTCGDCKRLLKRRGTL
jgi:hypothetical protein